MGFVLSKSYDNDPYYPRMRSYPYDLNRNHRHEHYVKDITLMYIGDVQNFQELLL